MYIMINTVILDRLLFKIYY